VWTEERTLRQILLNLGSNAIKYGGRGGCVHLAATAADGGAELRIRDEGPGMSEAQLARLFKPFERLGQEAGSVPGSGLGLVITRHLAQRIGARVHLESRPGEGTTAVLWLPVSAPAAPA
jgi:signal transduction histidine kinase